ncbi:MAG TPA: DUF2203 domain-containing protein [Patescibacteria group bacterium]|nr:DUF2203 domain-containing protein [Patescibacteria group bacterium]
MTRFFDLDEANAALPEVRGILESLRDERAELIRLRDQVLLHRPPAGAPAMAPTEANVGGSSRPIEPAEAIDTGESGSVRPADGPAVDPATDPSASDPEVRVLRLRMQGVIDRMQAGVARIDELGVTLREIETGLIDFPALASGRQIWLCWRLGEGDVETWHELGDGFPGRQALADLT